MRRLVIPPVLVAVPLALGCSPAPAPDAGASPDVAADAPDAPDAMDVPGADGALDAADVAVEDALADIQFSERRDVPVPDGTVCEPARLDGGGLGCRNNVEPGTGLFCVRYLCDADDGGATLDGCCRLVS